MSNFVKVQKAVWLMQCFGDKFTLAEVDAPTFANKIESEGYRVEQNGLEFKLIKDGLVISLFRPKVNFAQRKK